MTIVGVFDTQFSKKKRQKIFKIAEKLQKGKKLDYADVVEPSDDDITSGIIFLKHFGGNLPSYKKSLF